MQEYVDNLSNELLEAELRRILFVAVAEYSPEFDATTGDQTEATIDIIRLCDRLVVSRFKLKNEDFNQIENLCYAISDHYVDDFVDFEHNPDDFTEEFVTFHKICEHMFKFIEENSPPDEF